MHIVYALLIGGMLAGITAWSVVLNNRTPKPLGCESAVPDCRACGIVSCKIRRNNQKKEGEE